MPSAQPTYRWIPGHGPDPEALQRLRERAPMPKEPMGEAWFMGGERQMYTGLMQPDPRSWSKRELENALEALTSGPHSFGHSDEWSRWFDFLLPRALQRDDDSELYPLLVSALFVHCLDPALPGRDPGFRRDLLDTLGRRLMAPSCWDHGRAGGSDGLLRPLGGGFYAIAADGAIAAACCLVLRYLDADSIDGWIESVLAIDDPAWRCAFVVWLAGAAVLMFDGAQPASMGNPLYLGIGWDGHWLLDGSIPARSLDPDAAQFAFFHPAQVSALCASLKRRLDLSTMLVWGEQLAALSIPECDRTTTLWQYETAVVQVLDRYGLS
ncbi:MULTISPECIES: hypothetical protein [unclassified Lysobacter]|uniref:hypothetical protein n=1 Tax=unclassified Lysobacter TaxID=2635362 RepID=UPI001BEC2722|nr:MULTISPECIES: hypothetical protein [unclassified Lysobacter]MBT2749476.1 hypothetical protein [Lysobacter sp. ISL-42]MBT2753953.1 hypothetical protein [Lysobacter sp. ISL-50]MBT2779428.1 hypothetical protein [Lysobacter sp. ISL-54]MBT2782344.1 hypothetical protein [Lysobacter sp. ISL-52]